MRAAQLTLQQHPRVALLGIAVLLCVSVALVSVWHGSRADRQLLSKLKPTARFENDDWMALHESYVAEIKAGSGQAQDLIVLGDSITEAFRGKGFGMELGQFSENKAAWQALFASKYKASVYSISGDRVTHLLWRLRNGESLRGINVKVVMVLIGTNDVGQWGYQLQGEPEKAARAVFLGVRLVLQEVAAQAPAAQLLVLGLPPLQLALEDGSRNYYHQGIVDSVNEQLQEYVAQQQERRRRLHYVDCATPFFEAGGSRQVNLTLMPDGVHPSGPGGWMLGECMLRAMQRALGRAAH